MDIFKEYKVYLIILFVNLMFTFNIVAQSYLMVDFNFVLPIALFTVSVIVYFLLDLFIRKALHKILFLGIVTIILLLFIFYLILGTDLYVQTSSNVVSISHAANNGYITYFFQYRLLFIIFIPILVFVFLIFASYGLTDLILIYSMIVMILFWYLGFPNIIKKNLPIFIFIEVMSFGLNNCMGDLNKIKKSNPNIRINSGVLCFLILIPSLTISLITSKLPQDYKGNYTSILKEKSINAFGPSKINLVKSIYGLEASGYSSNIKKLGGPINVNGSLVLSVKADKPEYLRGTIKDYYNGSEWSRNKADYSLKVNKGYNVLSLKTSLTEFLYNKKNLIVYPEQNTNSSIFSPIYAYNVKLDKGTVYYDDIPTFVADLSKVKNYIVNYYDTPESEAFENCSNLDWLKSSLRDNSSEFTQKYGDYLQISPNITSRTINLLDSIAPGGQSRFESISKIKEYLDKNYPYTTSVSEVPENQEFIDNFLFTEKKGYCVYFATAATILCRMEGIPARYVEGFKMPDKRATDGLYKITNKEAHAWCEVLIDPSKDLWTTLEVTPSAASTAVAPIVIAAAIPVTSPIVNPINGVSNAEKNSANNVNNINIAGYKISRLYIIIVIAILILIIIRILSTLAGIKKVLKSQSAILYYKYCIKRLKQIGIIKPYNLGDLEYVETIEDSKLKAMLKNVVVTSYGEFYGMKSTKYVDRTDSYKELEAYIKKSERKSLYFIKKYLFF